MPKLVALKDTWAKIEPIQSRHLVKKAKVRLEKGEELDYESRLDVGTHSRLLVQNNDKFAASDHWYVFDSDVEYLFDSTRVGLAVPYLSQMDNQVKPYGTCNVTCVAMCLQYYQHANSAMDVLNWMTSKGLDRHVHSHLRQALEHFGVPDKFGVSVPFDAMKEHLEKEKPVIYSGKFTRSGHIIVLKGFNETGFIVHDPYGEYFSRGYKRNTLRGFTKFGKDLHYSYNLISRVSYGGSKAGWAHLVG